jgi:hypothetical protein
MIPGDKKFVFVVEQGCYSDRGVIGVYASSAEAMRDNPVPTEGYGYIKGAQWHQTLDSEPDAYWSNGCDWDAAICITRYEVQGEGR